MNYSCERWSRHCWWYIREAFHSCRNVGRDYCSHILPSSECGRPPPSASTQFLLEALWRVCRFNLPIIPLHHWSLQMHLISTLCELSALTRKPTTHSPDQQILKKEKYFAIKCSAIFERTLLFEGLLGFAPLSSPREQHVDKDEHVAFVEWYRQRKAEVLEEKRVLLPLIFRHKSYTAWPMIETEIRVILLVPHSKHTPSRLKRHSQCMYNLTLRYVSATIVTVEKKKYYVLWVCL